MIKNLLLYSFLGIIFLTSFELQPSDIKGKWYFSYESRVGTIKGIFNIKEKDGKLSGDIVASEFGIKHQFSKIEIKENDVLFLQVDNDNNKFELLINIKNKEFTGSISSIAGKTQVTGIKVE